MKKINKINTEALKITNCKCIYHIAEVLITAMIDAGFHRNGIRYGFNPYLQMLYISNDIPVRYRYSEKNVSAIIDISIEEILRSAQ